MNVSRFRVHRPKWVNLDMSVEIENRHGFGPRLPLDPAATIAMLVMHGSMMALSKFGSIEWVRWEDTGGFVAFSSQNGLT